MLRVICVLPIGDGLPIFGYGLLMAIGFATGILMAVRRARRRGISADAAMDVGILVVAAGIVGARLAYLIFDYEPGGGIIEWFAIWTGGLTLQGGVFLSLAAGFIYTRKKKLPFGGMADVYAPGLAFGLGFGRIGCLLNGCCWGKAAPAGFPLGITFPGDAGASVQQFLLAAHQPGLWADLMERLGYPAGTMPATPLYPVQIVSALGLFLIGAGLLLAERKFPKCPDGQTMLWLMFAYATGRFLIEFWRDDTPLRYGFGFFQGLRLGQWLALAMLIATAALQIYVNRRAEKPPTV